ncbi:MAG: hypothetical protein AAGA23_12400 [Pseudomonadota bacterium]
MKTFRRVTFPAKARWLASACRRLADGGTPSQRDVVRLALAWGNLGYAAGVSYLTLVGRHAARTQGPVLECGSGATTLLMGAVTQLRQVPVVALEHNPDWHAYVSELLSFLGFDHVRLELAPLTQYDEFQWYQAPADSAEGPYRLVVCDGPPGKTRGGRYGLLPVMGPQLSRDCMILLDDTHRSGEKQVIDHWRKHAKLTAHRLGRFGRYAEVTLC